MTTCKNVLLNTVCISYKGMQHVMLGIDKICRFTKQSDYIPLITVMYMGSVVMIFVCLVTNPTMHRLSIALLKGGGFRR